MTTPTTTEERISRLEGGQEHLATKADVESVKVDLERLRSEIERVRSEIERVPSEVKEEIGKLRAEIKDSKISTIVWITGIMVVVATAQVATGFAILRLLSP